MVSIDEDQGRLEAQVGDVRLTLRIDAVEKLEESGAETDIEKTVVRPRTIRPAALELDLRGHRADIAEAELDTYLNDAFMSNLDEVRIIHGYGTGAYVTWCASHWRPISWSNRSAPEDRARVETG